MANEIFKMSGQELAKVKFEVDALNKQLDSNRRSTTNELDKDAFLRLLTMQLSKQDPLSPMKNTDFIAQMAQFSALEQMKNMGESMKELKQHVSHGAMLDTIGKLVTYRNDEIVSEGVVEKLIMDETGAKLLIDGDRVSLDEVLSINEGVAESPKANK